MIDSGATSLFVDAEFLKINKLKPRKKKYPETLRVVDGRESCEGAIKYEIELHILLGDHKERALFQVTKLAEYPLILGKAWLDRHNPDIDWPSNSISFESKFCKKSCISLNSSETQLPSRSNPLLPLPDIRTASFSTLSKISKQYKSQIFAVSKNDILEHLKKKREN